MEKDPPDTGPERHLVSGTSECDKRTTVPNTGLSRNRINPFLGGLHEHSGRRIYGRYVQAGLFYQQGFIPYDVPVGGNSLFAAVVDQLRTKGEFSYSANILRQSAVKYLRKHPIQEDGTPFSSFLVDESWEKYLKRMTLDSEYGDQIITRAIAEVLQRPVVILSRALGQNQTVVIPQRHHRSGDNSQQLLISGRENTAYQSTTREIAPAYKAVTPSRQESLFLGQIDETDYVSLRPEEWKTTLADSLKRRCGSTEGNASPEHHLNFFFKYITHSIFIKGRDREYLTFNTPLSTHSMVTVCYVGPRADHLLSAIKPMFEQFLLPGPSRTDVKDIALADIPFSVIVMPHDTVVQEDLGQQHSSLLMITQPFALLMHSATCSDGYVKLKPVDPSRWKTALFRDEERLEFVRHLNVVDQSQFQLGTQNSVKLGFLSTWPPDATEWTSRHRPSGWPTQDMISSIVIAGCHIIPVASRNSIYPHTEWCFNFDIALRRLSREQLSPAQKSCFQLVFHLLTSTLQESHDMVYYLLQHTFFYACEKLEDTKFEKEPGSCVRQILKQLDQHLAEGRVPHYFMKTVDLIQNIPPCEVQQLLESIEILLNDLLMSVYFLLEKYGYTMPSALGRLLESTVDDVWRFSIHGQLEQTFVDFIYPESIRLIQECVCQKPVNYLSAKIVFQETLERLEKQSKTAACDLAEQLFRKVKAGFPDMQAWCLAFYLSETMQFGKVLFDVVCDGHQTRYLSDVFGSELLGYILTNDIDIPVEFTTESALVHITLQLTLILVGLHRDNAVEFLVESFVIKNRDYICKLAGKTDLSENVGDEITYGTIANLYNTYNSYVKLLFRLGKSEKFLEHMDVFEGLADRLKQPHLHHIISILWDEYGLSDRAVAAMKKANTTHRADYFQSSLSVDG